MKKLLFGCFIISIVFASCKKDIYIKNTDTVTATVQIQSLGVGSYYYLSDNAYLYLDATANGAISYHWLPTNETTPVIEFRPNNYILDYYWSGGNSYFGSYEVEVTFPDTTMKYELMVIAEEAIVYCPNSFTPNGDGDNDDWRAYANHTSKIVSLSIYDKENQKVFEWAEDNYLGWDGTYDGKLCDAGSYYFYVHYATAQGAKKSRDGLIQLIR
jgi:gliding motility-associated-like protein